MVSSWDVVLTSRSPGLLRMRLQGVIGPGVVDHLRTRLHQLVAPGRVPLAELVVDLTDVQMCHCRLLTVLDEARLRLEAAHGRLDVRGLRPEALAGFDEAGPVEVLAVYRASLAMARPQWPREPGWAAAPRRFSASEARLVGYGAALAGQDVTGTPVTDRLIAWCVQVLGVQAAVVLVTGEEAAGGVAVVGASDERARLTAVTGIGAGEGPVVDCLQRGEPVGVPDLDGPDGRWPRYASEAGRHGVRAVRVLPLRVPEPVGPGMSTTVGALVLLSGIPGPMAPTDLQVLAALADLAGTALARTAGRARGVPAFRGRALRRTVPALLTSANGQVAIERAVGVLVEREGLAPAAARARLVQLAAERDVAVDECARLVVASEVDDVRPAVVR